jgi:putative peptidoglycan lipid II flippase
VLVVPVAAATVAVALPLMRLVAFGRAEHTGPSLIAAGLASLAVGLFPYAALLLFARAFYAVGDSRTPAIVAIASAFAGVATIAVLAPLTHGAARVAAIGIGHTVAYSLGAIVLAALLVRRVGRRLVPREAVLAAVVAIPCAVAMWAVLDATDPRTRVSIVALLAVVTTVAGACYVLVMRRARHGRPLVDA